MMDSGRLVQAVLQGSWRAQPPPLELTPAELDRVAPLLQQTNAGGLAWQRLRGTPLAESETGRALADGFRMMALRNARQALNTAHAVAHLRSHGIEPILVKGWAVARCYPLPGLRPYGDIDLIVPQEQIHHAKELTAGLPGEVDIQRTTLYSVFERDYATLRQRSEGCVVADAPVQVLGPEDHLRLLCLHLLDHGAWRPLWLCDVAAALEHSTGALQWELLLSGRARTADWVLCALALAHELLGAEVTGTPAEEKVGRLPRWLAPAVLHHWSLGSAFAQREPFGAVLRREWRHPDRMADACRLRWPDPIRASVFCRAAFDERPRFAYQLRTALASIPKISRQILE